MSRSERQLRRTDYPTAAHETSGDRRRLYDLHTSQNAPRMRRSSNFLNASFFWPGLIQVDIGLSVRLDPAEE
jgi:hypothetical protein